MKIKDISVKYRGGFKGLYIDVGTLIRKQIPFDVVDFIRGKSCVHDCESYCRMQIRINGKLYVTWHSSEILTNFLEDCRAQETDEKKIFPIEDCMMVVGEDRGYYLQDASGIETTFTDKDIERLIRQKRRK
jgi:hypothetical protein